MDEKLQEDWLDARLREEAPYLDDDGFAARVVQRLPKRRQQRRWLRAFILLAVTLLASVIAYQMSDGGRFIADAVTRMATLPMLLIFLVALVCGVLITGLGLAAALKMREQPLR